MNLPRIFSFLFLIFFPTVLLGGQEKTIKDDLGYPHNPAPPPKRIISLAPNVTEILFSLGLDKEIVGVSRFCNFPQQARKKEKIGGMIDPSLEKILSLKPDLIFAFRGNPLRLIHRLKRLQLNVFVCTTGTTLESVFSLIEKIGQITHKQKEAERLVSLLRDDLERIKESLEDVSHYPKVFINLHGQGLWTTGKNSFLNDLVVTAKGINIAGRTSRPWLSYNREELIHQNPEYIIVLARTHKEFASAKEWFTQQAHLENIQAVRDGNIFFLNEDLATRPGPRIFKALDRLAEIIHPMLSKKGK
jgi:iron complex transport system substrate-binding protein